MDSDSVMKVDDYLCFSVYALSREYTRRYHSLLKDFGLTYTQFITLLVLWEEDQISVKQLGERLYLDSGTLTPLLKKLENMGILTRVRNKQDERSVTISLTKQGAKLKEYAMDIPEKLFSQAGVSQEEAEALRVQISEMLMKFRQLTI